MSQQVRVVAYDARWADEFRKESEKIKEILGGIITPRPPAVAASEADHTVSYRRL